MHTQTTTQYGLQMTQNLNNFLIEQDNKKYATQNGRRVHAVLRNIIIDNIRGNSGNSDIVKMIQKQPDLHKFFSCTAKTEVPIAGIVNGVFISRRIDRLLIDDVAKMIEFIDYKTDINKNEFIDKYTKQLNEYAQLLRSGYPGYKIVGFILWVQDWQLQQIISL